MKRKLRILPAIILCLAVFSAACQAKGDVSADNASASETTLWNNILMLGSDALSGEADDTQTFVILSVNTTDRKVVLTSVMQDVAVMTDAYGERALRELYALGGMPLLLEEMNKLLGVAMIRYIVIDMTPLSQIVDILGGVPLNCDDALFDELCVMLAEAGEDIPPSDGVEQYNGAQALLYSRLRKPVGDTYTLNTSQRDVIIAASQTVLQSGVFACIRIVPKLFDMLTMNIPFGELIGMVYGLAGMDASAIPEIWVPERANEAVCLAGGWLLRVDEPACAERFRTGLGG